MRMNIKGQPNEQQVMLYLLRYPERRSLVIEVDYGYYTDIIEWQFVVCELVQEER